MNGQKVKELNRMLSSPATKRQKRIFHTLSQSAKARIKKLPGNEWLILDRELGELVE